MLDSDLVELYGVETKALVQAVKRNLERFPNDFMFQLNKEEFDFIYQFLIMAIRLHNCLVRRYVFERGPSGVLSGRGDLCFQTGPGMAVSEGSHCQVAGQCTGRGQASATVEG